MLKPSPRLVALGLACALLTACRTTRPVDPRPNKPITTEAHTLVLSNATTAPITLLPGRGSPAPIVLPPGESRTLDFAVRLEENVSSGQEREVVLVEEKSSPFVTQSAIDLVIKAKFATGPERSLRVRLGSCLFDPANTTVSHPLSLQKPPLAGVPALKLCP
jgi:hypothetical protein